MTDYSEDFFLDPGVTIKQEPQQNDTTMSASASVPIPGRRLVDMSSLRDIGFDLELSQSSSFKDYKDINFMDQIHTTPEHTIFSGNSMWGTRLLDIDAQKSEALIHMDDDDILQVDKADLIQGPTLAELNANDENLLEDLNFDDLLLPEENSYFFSSLSQVDPQKLSMPLQVNNNTNLANNNIQTLAAASCPQANLGYYREAFDSTSISSSPFDTYVSKTSVPAFSPTSQTSSTSSLLQSAPSPVPHMSGTSQQKHSTLHELLLKRENFGVSPDRSLLGQSVPGQSSPVVGNQSIRWPRGHTSRLSSSAPTHLGLEQIWQRREPRKHLLSTGSLAEAGSTSSISTGGVLSPEAPDFSHDELDSDEDSDHYEDFSSDNGDSDNEGDRHLSAAKKERFFWQYNVQAKGPKGQRLIMKTKMEDPHVLNEVTDPVFSPDCSMRGIKHSGKARKGDGNDLTPNPRKLYSIGKELDKLGRIINDMTPVSELPFNVRPKSRKEKNKLASRACRLKKKAQHEANKIKLHGLENEHRRLLNAIIQAKQVLSAKISEATDGQVELTKHLEKVVKKIKIAGSSTEYVNKVLDKVKSGVPGGGMNLQES